MSGGGCHRSTEIRRFPGESVIGLASLRQYYMRDEWHLNFGQLPNFVNLWRCFRILCRKQYGGWCEWIVEQNSAIVLFNRTVLCTFRCHQIRSCSWLVDNSYMTIQAKGFRTADSKLLVSFPGRVPVSDFLCWIMHPTCPSDVLPFSCSCLQVTEKAAM